MLVLTRKVGERIVIDNHIIIEVLQVKGSRVRLGIEAPAGATVLRQELLLNGRGAVQIPGSGDHELANQA
jgi:carbon storage regulator